MKYKDIVTKAKEIKTTVETKYTLPYSTPVYYIAKAILLQNKKDITSIKIETATKPTGDHISNQIYKTDYIDMAKRLVQYVETYYQLPKYITWKKQKVTVKDYTYMFARILVYYNTHGELPKYANVNSKAYTKPTESDNEVYTYFKKVFGDFGNTIDGALSKIAGNGYGYYYDDQYSNRQSIDRMAKGYGVNCTDSAQVFYNIAKALGYQVRCVHVKCQGGDGHVRLQVKHATRTGGEWINRDPAAVLDSGSVTHNWCLNGTILAYDPSWFMQNLLR